MITEQTESTDEIQPRKTSGILTNARICANVPTANLEHARRFYEEVLGLKAAISDERRGVYYQAGGGTMLNLYERSQAAAEHSVATFLVENLEEVMSKLRGRGIVFEEYEMPDLKTENGIYSDETGFQVAWFKDPHGNILSLEQLPNE